MGISNGFYPQWQSARAPYHLQTPTNIARLTSSAGIQVPFDGAQQANAGAQDSFNIDIGKVASATIRPMGSESYTISADITAAGQIVQKGLNGYQLVGQLDAGGNYQLASGLFGNVFRDPYLLLGGYKSDDNPFAQTMKTVERLRAEKSSEIPVIRQALTSKGITGRGIKVGILDPLDKDEKNNQLKISDHSRVVQSVIQDPVWGVAPESSILHVGNPPDEKKEDALKDDNLQGCYQWMISDFTKLYTDRVKQISDVIAMRDPGLRVLNMTWGTNRLYQYSKLWRTINEADDNQRYKYPTVRAAILGPAINGSYQQQFQAVVNSLDNMLDNSSEVRQAHQLYIEATRQAANSGITLVGAMGNAHGDLYHQVRTKPGSEMDIFAMSPYVIASAGSNSNMTPGYQQDDFVYPKSSRGDGTQWNPTIAAPGQEVRVGMPIASAAPTLSTQGTSFSTPYTCGVIALMLQRNPFLTFDQIKAKLQATATPMQGHTVAEQGAGVINPEAAILS